MNEIDWTRGRVFILADKTGIVETRKENLEYFAHFNWYIESCIDDYFNIGIDFEPINVYDNNTGDNFDIPSEPYQEYLKEKIEEEINLDPYFLGLENYHEDRYLDFD